MLNCEYPLNQYDGMHNYANQLDELVVDEQGGPVLRMHWQAQNPAKIITSRGKLALTFDPAVDSYIYDVATELEVNPGKEWKNTADGLEYCNLVAYNTVGPSAPVKDPWPWNYQWILYRSADDAVYRHPIHHNGIPPVYPKPNGGFYLYVPVEEMRIAPAVELADPPDPALKPYAGLCNWAYDIHFRYNPYQGGQVMAAGTKHQAHYRVLAYDQAKVQALLATAKLDARFANGQELAAFVPGVNDFKLGRRYDTPHGEYDWIGGIWDKTTGHGDSFSQRLEGKSRCLCTTGGSYFMDGYSDGQYELSAWIKTKEVTGRGATLFVTTNDGKGEKTVYRTERLTGTMDWTLINFRPDNISAATYSVQPGMELDGGGTVWFDDVELKRVGE